MKRRHSQAVQAISLFCSLVSHVALLVWLDRHTIPFAAAVAPPPLRELVAKEEALRDALSTFVRAEAPTVVLETPLPPPKLAPPQVELASPVSTATVHTALVELPPKMLQFQPPALPRHNILAHLPKELIVPPASDTATISHAAPLLHPALSIASPPVPQLISPPPLSHPLNHPARPFWHAAPPRPFFSPIALTTPLPTLAELDTVSCSDLYEAEVVFIPLENEEGVAFAITLVPKGEAPLPKLSQRYTFLIDRSNSIQRDRLVATKTAIQKSLAEINPDARFNLVAFDSKVEKWRPSAQSATEENQASAISFLGGVELGSFFSPPDYFRPLLLTVPGHLEEDEIHTAILLTDGEALHKKQQQRALLQEWTGLNQGRVCLYIISLSDDKQGPALDAACAFNRGKWIPVHAKRGIRRKLAKLLQSIDAPIAQYVSCKPIAKAPQHKIEIHLAPHASLPLFAGQPYVITGKSDRMEDFILFLQAKGNGKWVHIKKQISFLNARRGGEALRAGWALQKAYRIYERYLQDENPRHLAEAERLLSPLNLPMALNLSQ